MTKKSLKRKRERDDEQVGSEAYFREMANVRGRFCGGCRSCREEKRNRVVTTPYVDGRKERARSFYPLR